MIKQTARASRDTLRRCKLAAGRLGLALIVAAVSACATTSGVGDPDPSNCVPAETEDCSSGGGGGNVSGWPTGGSAGIGANGGSASGWSGGAGGAGGLAGASGGAGGSEPIPPPDISGFSALSCSSGCCFDGTDQLAIQIYDDYFAARGFPQSKADLWSQTTTLAGSAVDSVKFSMLPSGFSDDDYHAYYSFLEQITAGGQSYKRITNQDNSSLFAGFSGTLDAWRRFNVHDFTPAVATHYTRNATVDVMARQFIYRLKCNQQYAEALSQCSDCVDAFTAFSAHDIGRIFTIRVARPTAAGNAFELSRELKVISTDASGQLAAHSQEAINYFGALGGSTYRAIWRAELSGKLAALAEHTGSPTPIVIRAE